MHEFADATPTMRFSTDMFTPRERVTAWREFFGRGIVKLEIESLSPEDFRSSATLRLLPDLGIVSGTSTPIRFDRPRHLIDNDDVAFSIMLSGESRFAVRGREDVIRTGDAVMMGAGEGGMNEAHVNCAFVALRMPRRALAPTRTQVTDLLGRRIPAESPALQLLRHYLGILDDRRALDTQNLQRMAATHIHDLIGLSLGATRDAAHEAESRSLGAVRLKAIKDDIDRNLGDCDVSVGAVAMRHRVTPRYLQMLFESEGTTFTAHVLARRLARAHRMLGDTRNAGGTISAVAFDCGFGDVSYFHRAFRRRYGASPSEIRAQARRDGTHPDVAGRS